jgi:hypothetical protein
VTPNGVIHSSVTSTSRSRTVPLPVVRCPTASQSSISTPLLHRRLVRLPEQVSDLIAELHGQVEAYRE